MKKLYLFAALAAMLAACSENDLTAEKQVVQQNAEEEVVDFDVYVNRGLTRGGVNGPITTERIKGDPVGNKASLAGFGVFGYYTDGEPYSAITKPNFFYNQQVSYNSGVSRWTYSPVKYWPNEFGNDSKSDQVDRVTLFAYLPYVDVDPITGVVKPSGTPVSPETDPTTNITGMTRNTATGDPFIKYSATMDPENSVDLCYGVAADRFTSSNSGINRNDIAKGKPYVDVAKPGKDANSKIKFDFKHATAQLNVTIDANVTDMTTGTTEIRTNHTRIWVRSVTFTGITQKGALNLNSDANEGPEWYDVNGNSKITTGSLTVYDGRKDDKEANDAASNESPATLNTNIVQDEQYSISDAVIPVIEEPTKLGVTATKLNLFNSVNTAAPVFVIPTKEKMRVTIVYDVETVDKNLPYYLSDGKTPGSTIQNTIYKDIDTFGEITAGYCYTLNLHLGMRTVDFDAAVTAWQDMQADVDLPSNLQTFAATSTGGSGSVILPATANSYDFAVSGLKVNVKPYVPAATSFGNATFTPTAANGSGIAKISVTGFTTNTTTKNVSYGSARIGNYSGNYVDVAFTHAAAPLGLKNPAYNKTGTAPSFSYEFTYQVTASGYTNASDLQAAATKYEVFENGVLLIKDTDYTLDTGTHKILLNVEPASGTILKLYVKVNDAPAESITKTVP